MVNKSTIIMIDSFKGIIPIKRVCEILRISRSTYYYHKNHLMDNELTDTESEVKNICIKTKFLYGYRKIHAILNRFFNCSISKVQKIMSEFGWGCRVRQKRSHRPGNPYKQFDNIINRNWESNAPLKKLTTDITYIPCGDKFIYLSTILDAYNSEIVAFEFSEHPDTKLVIDTLNQLDNIDGSILHSDQGATYTSFDYFDLARKKGVIRSMSRKGTPADNAIIESFHSTLKSEMIYIKDKPKGLSETIKYITDYIKFWNNERILTKLGNQSPVEYRELNA
ncbi:IS3 family transposase [Fructilactobacillus frigidiflavus]|uniref:IS3 family transposase n=1 Tax=Fructilactobacillus frigidiflavus TaxID=3242688 RepID=UPI003757C93E